MTKLLLFLPLLIFSSCAQEPAEIKIDIPMLIAQANRYQLPTPPSGSRLVLAKTDYTTTTSNRSSDLDPSIYKPGFLLENRANGKSEVMTGFEQSVSSPARKHQPATLPFSAKPTKPKPGHYFYRGNSQATFCTALQCARRGDLQNASALFQNFYRSEYKDLNFDYPQSSLLPKNASTLLALATFDYHYQHLRREDSNVKQSLIVLEKLRTEFPQLFPEDKEDFASYPRTAFLNDLGLTVKSKPPKPGSIEDLIGQVAASHVPSHMRESDHPIFKIYLRGTSAIPELVRLSTSRKLTPAIQPAFMNAREKRLRIGHLAGSILEDMAGTLSASKTGNSIQRFHTLDDRWKPWLTKTNISAEKAFFTRALGDPTRLEKIPSEVPLVILLQKYPSSTLDLAKQFSTSKHVSLFIGALMDSKLKKATKLKALKTVSQKQKGMARRYMIQNLARLDSTAATREVLPLIAALPQDVNTPYWTAEEANLTHIVMQLDDTTVWKAFLAKAKTCSIGLRMELMNSMNYSYIGKKNESLRLAFLAAFLNDSEVRKISGSDPRWEGPYAGFTYDRLSVRNFVSEIIASILKVPGEPADHWKEKQWKPFREEVQRAVSKLTLPDLS